jgi:hypothetical protein
MTTDDTYRPTQEFRDHLEWEVTRAVRRARHGDQRSRRRGRWLRAAAVVLVSVAIGTTAGLASAQIRDSERRDSLLQAANADASLAALRLQLARERLADVNRKLQAGAVGAASLADATSEVRSMEAQAMRARFNVEEIRATAQAPRDDLNAPLVAGHDFVKDRIQLELMSAQQRLTAAEQAQAESQRRVRVGAETELSGLEAGVDLARARAAMALLAERLNLRREFLEKGTPVDRLLQRFEQAQLRQDATVAQQTLNIAHERLTLIEKQRAAGVTDDLAVLKARVEVKEREIELQQILLRLRNPSLTVSSPPR